jgi:hypothetical protein
VSKKTIGVSLKSYRGFAVNLSGHLIDICSMVSYRYLVPTYIVMIKYRQLTFKTANALTHVMTREGYSLIPEGSEGTSRQAPGCSSCHPTDGLDVQAGIPLFIIIDPALLLRVLIWFFGNIFFFYNKNNF